MSNILHLKRKKSGMQNIFEGLLAAREQFYSQTTHTKPKGMVNIIYKKRRTNYELD